MNEHLQAIATLFSLVNPMVCAMMFTNLSSNRTSAQKATDATRAIFVIAVVLVIAALIGARILGVFGISLDVFSVAGGIILAFIGFKMLAEKASSEKPETGSQAANGNGSGSTLAPMILFAASPGTITGVITISAAHSGKDLPIPALVAIGVVLLVTWLFLLLTARRAHGDGPVTPSLAHDMTSRYMGLIVIAMGVQFILTGYKAFMAG